MRVMKNILENKKIKKRPLALIGYKRHPSPPFQTFLDSLLMTCNHM